MTDDRSQRHQTEEDLRRLGRTHAVLSRCNRSLTRALDERALLNAFCANLVEVEGYGFAWVGYAGERREAPLRLVGHARQSDAAFAASVLSCANAGGRRSACRVACAFRIPVILRDLSVRSALAPGPTRHWSRAIGP